MSVSARDRFAVLLLFVAGVAFGLAIGWITVAREPAPLRMFSCPVYQPPATQIPQAPEDCK